MQKSYFVPRFKKRTTNDCFEGIELTLFELDSAVQGTVYDLFTGDFAMADGQTTAHYHIELSLKTPSAVLIEGEMIDSSGNVITKIPQYKTDAGSTIVQHKVSGDIKNVSGDVLLHVRAEYTTSNNSVQTPELIIPLTPILPEGSHTLIHPTKRKEGEPVRRYGTKSPYRTLNCGGPEPNYVVTVLDCDASNDSNVDYICKWGNSGSTYNPYFGIPGAGSVKGPKNGVIDLKENPPIATCIATSRDRNIGGAMLIASINSIKWVGDIAKESGFGVSTYETVPGDITFSIGSSSNILNYEFLGAWNNGNTPLINPERSNLKYFDYTLRMTIPFKVPNKVQNYQVIVTSIKQTSQTALVDDSVLPIKAMYDCFAKGSKVLTPMGEVNVENIKIGDVLLTTTGEQVVNNIHMSFETSYLCISCKEFRDISLTEDHLILTQSGLVATKNLKINDEIITKNGNAIIRDINKCTGEVYGLNTLGMIYVNDYIVDGGE